VARLDGRDILSLGARSSHQAPQVLQVHDSPMQQEKVDKRMP